MNSQIVNAVELKSIAALLHDARFTLADIAFSDETGVFTLKCWVLKSVSQNWQECQILFNSVVDCKIKISEKVRYYELATIRFAEHSQYLELIAHYGVEVSLTVDRLNGKYGETGKSREKWD